MKASLGNLDFWDTFGGAAVLMLASPGAALRDGRSRRCSSATAPRCRSRPPCGASSIGLVGAIAAIVRMLERPEHATGLCAGAWLGLAGALLILIGAWHRDARRTPLAASPGRTRAAAAARSAFALCVDCAACDRPR